MVCFWRPIEQTIFGTVYKLMDLQQNLFSPDLPFKLHAKLQHTPTMLSYVASTSCQVKLVIIINNYCTLQYEIPRFITPEVGDIF